MQEFREFLAEAIVGIKDSKEAFRFAQNVAVMYLNNVAADKDVMDITYENSENGMFIIDSENAESQGFFNKIVQCEDSEEARVKVTQDNACFLWRDLVYVVASGNAWILLNKNVLAVPKEKWYKIQTSYDDATKNAQPKESQDK